MVFGAVRFVEYSCRLSRLLELVQAVQSVYHHVIVKFLKI